MALLAAAFLVPPLVNLGRYQRRIAGAISGSLGRPVTLSSVHLRLLPTPGLEITDFTVQEDPAFGAEPTLCAPTVVASMRLTSLWRGRLEASRISLDAPSLNLARNAAGRWNLGTILLQASHVQNAPTAQRLSGSAPRFPYIEATNARINFKEGAEKRPFSLESADFSMWLARPDQWQLRLEGQPVRTDMPLDPGDTGLLRLEGSLTRAASIDQMAVSMRTSLTGLPLGQMSRLLLGRDAGWRGEVTLAGRIEGRVEQLHLTSHLQVAALERQEFAAAEPLTLAAECAGDYRHGSHTVENLNCLAPVSTGLLTVRSAGPQFSVSFDNVPAGEVLSVLRLLRRNAAPGVTAAGRVDGRFTFAPQPFSLAGEATAAGVVLNGPGLGTVATVAPLHLPVLHVLAAGSASAPHRPPRGAGRVPGFHSADAASDPALLSIEPFQVSDALPLTFNAVLTRRGFALHLTGTAPLAPLLACARALGAGGRILHGLSSRPPVQDAGHKTGSVPAAASVDVTVRGPWLAPASEAQAETATGALHLADALWKPGFLGGSAQPVEIASADALLAPGRITWSRLSATYHGMPLALSLSLAASCPAGEICPAHFDLETPRLSAAELEAALVNPGGHAPLVQALLSRVQGSSADWPAMEGTVHTAELMLGRLPLHEVTAALTIAGRRAQLRSLDARMLSGVVHVTGSMDASSGAPAYTLEAALGHVDTAAVAALLAQHWGGGPATANLTLKLQGFTAAELAASGAGTFQFDWSQGALAEHFDRWSAEGTIENRDLTITRSTLVRAGNTQPVTGHATFDGTLNLFIGGTPLGGTLGHPVPGQPR